MKTASKTNRYILYARKCPLSNGCRPRFSAHQRGLIPLEHHHIVCMAHWQASITRQPPKTKVELRQMLTEAVRNTKPSAHHGAKPAPKAKKNAAEVAYID